MERKIIDNQFRYAHERSDHPNGKAFSRHLHNEYEILYFMEGQANFVVEHLSYSLKPGDVVLVPPMKYHFIDIKADVPYERMVIDFDGSSISQPLLETVFDRPKILSCSANHDIVNVFGRLDAYTARFDERVRGLLASNLLTELLYLVADGTLPMRQGYTYGAETLNRALEYIAENLVTIQDIDTIDTGIFVSRSYLHRVFRDSLGISPMKYVNEKKLLLAESCIRVGEKPSHVYTKCGFGDYSSFYRAYKGRFGIPPTGAGRDVVNFDKEHIDS